VLKALAKVTSSKDLTKRVRQSLQSLEKTDVYVGIPEGQDGNHPNITNAQLMYVLTHGVRRKEMRDAMDEYMGLTPGGMPIMRDFERFLTNMETMPYSAAYQLYLYEHGSPLWRIPPRPILEPAINHYKDIIAKPLRQAAVNALDGSDPMPSLHKAGELGVEAAKDWFVNPLNMWPPNSPVTVHGSKPDKHGKKFIKGKGSDQPNIDTGNLRNSITYVVANAP